MVLAHSSNPACTPARLDEKHAAADTVRGGNRSLESVDLPAIREHLHDSVAHLAEQGLYGDQPDRCSLHNYE